VKPETKQYFEALRLKLALEFSAFGHLSKIHTPGQHIFTNAYWESLKAFERIQLR
jgi:hypothetical protein